MTDSAVPHRGGRRPRRRLSWAAVVGFGALGMLWPLLRLVGLESVIGVLPTAVVAYLTALTIWVLGAGFGDVPRPVITLTFSGLVFAAAQIAASVVLNEWPDHGVVLHIVAGTIELIRAAGLGALAGLLAEYIQRGIARRRG